jgi:hypothetical protein
VSIVRPIERGQPSFPEDSNAKTGSSVGLHARQDMSRSQHYTAIRERSPAIGALAEFAPVLCEVRDLGWIMATLLELAGSGRGHLQPSQRVVRHGARPEIASCGPIQAGVISRAATWDKDS